MSDTTQAHHGPTPPGSHYQPALSVVLIIVVLFVAAAFFMLRYVNPAAAPGVTTTLPSSVTTTTVHHATVAKSSVRVQVANGTTISNLARSYTQDLLTQGWNTQPQVNGPKETKTVVYYNPGFKWAAIQICNRIHISVHAVQALNGQRPVAGASSDDVIVILGPDAPRGG
ncbi:MAG TPA: LytR C-terminal domain-containing protein [Acidimicrobiales bacterium]